MSLPLSKFLIRQSKKRSGGHLLATTARSLYPLYCLLAGSGASGGRGSVSGFGTLNMPVSGGFPRIRWFRISLEEIPLTSSTVILLHVSAMFSSAVGCAWLVEANAETVSTEIAKIKILIAGPPVSLLAENHILDD